MTSCQGSFPWKPASVVCPASEPPRFLITTVSPTSCESKHDVAKTSAPTAMGRSPKAAGISCAFE